MHASSPLPLGRSLEHTLRLKAADGFALGATVFEPLGEARGTVIINGATAVPASYYRRFAEHLAGSGLRVLTYDYRGVGASRPSNLRGFSASMTDWAKLDARAALAWAESAAKNSPLVLVGHSFGGQLLGLIDEARAASGVVLIATQFGYYGHWPLGSRLRLGITWHALVPTLTKSFGYLPGKAGIGEDLPAGVAEEWALWCRHPDYLMGYHPDARARFARFDRPTLLYSFSDDDYAPEASVEHLIASLPAAPLTHERVSPAQLGVPEIGHFGFFRVRFADTLWREARWFIDDVCEGRSAFRLAPRRNAWEFSIDDVLADLDYGRT